MVVVDGLLRSGRGNGVTMEVFFFFFATMVCGCGRWWFKLRPRDWWLVLSFEAPAMAMVIVACVEF